MRAVAKVKSDFALAAVDLDRRLKDQPSYEQKLRKLQLAMLELEQIYRVDRRRGIYLAALDDMFAQTSTATAPWFVVPAEYKWLRASPSREPR